MAINMCFEELDISHVGGGSRDTGTGLLLHKEDGFATMINYVAVQVEMPEGEYEIPLCERTKRIRSGDIIIDEKKVYLATERGYSSRESPENRVLLLSFEEHPGLRNAPEYQNVGVHNLTDLMKRKREI